MATSTVSNAAQVSDDPKVQHHYATQTAVALAFIAALKAIWRTINPRDLKGTLPAYTTQVHALVEQFSQASIEVAVQHYEDMREQAGTKGVFTTPRVDTPPAEQIDKMLDSIFYDLWQPEGTSQAVMDALTTEAVNALEAQMPTPVLNSGRNELIEAIEKDRWARGYARVTKPGACWFCTLLATRDPVYKSAETAGDVNKYHDNDRCTIVPLFADSYEPPAHIREATDLYYDATGTIRGSDAKRQAFKDAWNGRTTDGTPGTGPGPKAPKPSPTSNGFQSLSRDEIVNQIKVLEGISKDSQWRTDQLARFRKRLEQLS